MGGKDLGGRFRGYYWWGGGGGDLVDANVHVNLSNKLSTHFANLYLTSLAAVCQPRT